MLVEESGFVGADAPDIFEVGGREEGVQFGRGEGGEVENPG